MYNTHLLVLLHNFVTGKSIMTVYRSLHHTHKLPYVLIIVAIWQPFRLEDVKQFFPSLPALHAGLLYSRHGGDVPLLYSLLLEVGYVAFRTIGTGSLS